MLIGHAVAPAEGRYPSAYCEYAFGIFKASAGCDLFYYRCAYGEAEEVACEKGLAYDDRTHTCNWPDLLLDVGCVPESRSHLNKHVATCNEPFY